VTKELNDMLAHLEPTNRCLWCQVRIQTGGNICSECYPGHIKLWEEHTKIYDALVEESMVEERRYTLAKREFHKQQLKKRAGER